MGLQVEEIEHSRASCEAGEKKNMKDERRKKQKMRNEVEET